MQASDDELRAYVEAFRQVEQPSVAARRRTHFALQGRIAKARASAVNRWRSTLSMAVAAGLVLAFAGTWGAIRATKRPSSEQLNATYTAIPLSSRETQAYARRPSAIPVKVEVPAVSSEPVSSEPAVAPLVEQSVPEVFEQRSTIARRTEPARPARRHTTTGKVSTPSIEPVSENTRPVPEIQSVLPAEVLSLQHAQAALAGGDPGRALALLDEHGRRFSAGAFEEERAVSRIDALCRLGRHDEARAVASDFHVRWRGSNLAHRAKCE